VIAFFLKMYIYKMYISCFVATPWPLIVTLMVSDALCLFTVLSHRLYNNVLLNDPTL
jgi:hypothetical protein